MSAYQPSRIPKAEESSLSASDIIYFWEWNLVRVWCNKRYILKLGFTSASSLSCHSLDSLMLQLSSLAHFCVVCFSQRLWAVQSDARVLQLGSRAGWHSQDLWWLPRRPAHPHCELAPFHLWNSLPYDDRHSVSTSSFKQALKTHLFKSAYN